MRHFLEKRRQAQSEGNTEEEELAKLYGDTHLYPDPDACTTTDWYTSSAGNENLETIMYNASIDAHRIDQILTVEDMIAIEADNDEWNSFAEPATVPCERYYRGCACKKCTGYVFPLPFGGYCMLRTDDALEHGLTLTGFYLHLDD